MAEWEEFGISEDLISAAENASGIKNVLQSVAEVVDTISSLLNIIKTFLNALNDPKLAAIKSLLNAIQGIIDSLQESGIFALFLVPENIEDLGQNYSGGFEAFEQKFINSLLDTQDPQRPQIESSGALGTLLFYFSSPDASTTLGNVNKLFTIFDRNKRKYPAPVNAKILPADNSGVPLDQSFVKAFQGDGEAEQLLFQWEEPKVANDIFLDLFANNKFYIEKAKNVSGDRIKLDRIPTDKENPLEKETRKNGDQPNLGRYVEDPNNGATIRVWKPLDENDPFIEPSEAKANNRVDFLAGSYGYILEDVEKGIENGYYYRVSSVPQDVELEEVQGRKVLKRNGFIYRDSNPTSPVFGAIPDVDYSFDLPTALLNIIRTAYLLRMDERINDQQSAPLPGNERIDPVLPESLLDSDLDGIEKYIFEENTIEMSVNFLSAPLFEDSITGFNQARREVKTGLTVEPEEFDPFGGVDEFMQPLISKGPSERFRLKVDRIAEGKVEKLTSIVGKNDQLFQAFQSQYKEIQSDIEEFLTSETSLSEFLDRDFRSNIAFLLRLTEGNIRQGTPPNWESIRLVEDLLPEVNRLFDNLFNTISAFDATFQNKISDFEDNIEGLQDRLEKITSIIEQIESAIDFLKKINATLDIGVSVVWIPPQKGGTAQVVQEVKNAKEKPDSGPEDFFSGMAFAVGGPSAGAVKTSAEAIKLIFGV